LLTFSASLFLQFQKHFSLILSLYRFSFDPHFAAEKANEAKTKGNAAWLNGRFKDAADFFTQAIELDPTKPEFFRNRSASYLRLKNYDLVGLSLPAYSFDLLINQILLSYSSRHFKTQRKPLI
jgi:tetratricopeptide (TPR) repeat protein